MPRTRVLAVDDERLIRLSLRHVLPREGFDVDTARSAAEALELLDRKHYDLVLTDLRLPDSSGLEVLKHAKEGHPTLPVILVTASEEAISSEAAAAAGAAAVIRKPFKLATLVAEARRCAHGTTAPDAPPVPTGRSAPTELE